MSADRKMVGALSKLGRTVPCALALAGACVSWLLLEGDLDVYAGGLAGRMFCGESGVWDCSRVASHPSAWLYGYPLALLGCLYFLLVFWIAGSALLHDGIDRKAYLALGTIVCSLGFAFDLYLGVVMVTQVGALCSMCLVTYAINFVLALSFWRLDRACRQPVRWSKLLAPWKWWVGHAPAEHYKHAVKTGVAVLSACVLLAAYVEGVAPFHRLNDEIDDELFRFMMRMDTKPPDVDMRRLEGRPSIGPMDAPIAIGVVGDFQCVYCRALSRRLSAWRERFPDRIRLTFVHSPISSKCNPDVHEDLHPDACWIAAAAVCAEERGAFWRFHDHVFDSMSQASVDREQVLAALAEMSLDASEIESRIASGEPERRVASDVALCAELGLTSTPSIVVNGYAHRGSMLPRMLDGLMELLLHRAEESRTAGGSGASAH